MDIKSIVRAFRYGELQAKAEANPSAKRPPTIKFLAIFVVAGVLIVTGALVWLDGVEDGLRADRDGGGPLEVTMPTSSTAPIASPTNTTQPSLPTPSSPTAEA